MGSTPGFLYSQLFAVPPPAQREPPCFNYVDVRDAVEMHVRALEIEAAGGERFIASSRKPFVCIEVYYSPMANLIFALYRRLQLARLAYVSSHTTHSHN